MARVAWIVPFQLVLSGTAARCSEMDGLSGHRAHAQGLRQKGAPDAEYGQRNQGRSHVLRCVMRMAIFQSQRHRHIVDSSGTAARHTHGAQVEMQMRFMSLSDVDQQKMEVHLEV